MKIVLERLRFLTSLNILSRNAGMSADPSGMQRYVRISVTKKRITMSSWNGMTMLTTWMSQGIIECDSDGVILIPFDKLYGIAQASSTKKITIEETKETRFAIRANGTSSVSGIPATEFPNVVSEGSELIAETTLAKFVKRIGMVEKCIADESFTQAELKGVLWNGDFVATDTSRASIYLGKKIDSSYILPRTTVILLLDIYKDAKESELKVYSSGTVLIFKGTNFVLTSTLINSKYPDYKIILDKTEKSDKKIEFDKKEMREILNRCKVFEDRVLKVNKSMDAAILLTVEEGKLRVKIGDNENHSEYVKSATVTSKKKDNLYLKASALRDCVELSSDDKVVLEYSDSRSPVFVKQGKWVYFTLPMRRDV